MVKSPGLGPGNRRFKSCHPDMSTFDERQQARKNAAKRLRIAANIVRDSSDVMYEAMAYLFDRTARMGELDPDMLARVPCDQVIELADAVLDYPREIPGRSLSLLLAL